MIYIYDILLNWTDTNKIYEFFEWDVNDNIEHIKRIGLIKVTSKQMSDIITHDIKVDNNLLEDIYNLTEVFKEKRVINLEYACLITDGNIVIAIEFDKDGNSLYKSRLLLDEEEEVLELSLKRDYYELNYSINNDNKAPNYLLTRKEEGIKRYLLQEIIDTYKEQNINKLKYIYSEYTNKVLNDTDLMYKELVSSLDFVLTSKHQKIYDLLKLSHTKKQV